MSPVTTCPLCEATCGLEVTFEGDRVARVVGDARDVFSHGFICPKGGSLGALHHDPDRLRTPLVRRGGELVEATGDEAFAESDRRLQPILAQDRNAVAVYAGNPSAQNLAAMLYGRVFNKALGTRNVFSASTVDQMPKHVSAGYMFGGFGNDVMKGGKAPDAVYGEEDAVCRSRCSSHSTVLWVWSYRPSS